MTTETRVYKAWSPSRNIASTFEVVDALRAEGWRSILFDLGGGWRMEFSKYPDGSIIGREHKDRLHAILLAALAVRGVSDEEVQAAIKEGA